MQTFSHFLMTALTKRKLEQKGVSLSGKALMVGSFMPDVPLIVFTLWFFAYYRWYNPLPPSGDPFGPLYDRYYFTHPIWITGHSLFHSPPMLALWLGLGYWGRKQDWGRVLLWFALGCAFHSSVDIVTHFDDGPLLFYPFDWQTRFSSPVSYWHHDHYGNIFGPLELLLDLGIVAFFITRQAWVQARLGLTK